MVEEISPSQIRRQRFEMVRRGFDPQEVGAYLERVAERLAAAERVAEEAQTRLSSTSHELEDAKAAEEALQLTMVAATQAKDEMLARARAEAQEVRGTAQREAEAVLAEARRQASALVDESRHDAGSVVSAAHGEHGELLAQVDRLREVVSRVRSMLASVAGFADPALDKAERMLADPAAVEFDDEPVDDAPESERPRPGETDGKGVPGPDFAVVSSPPALEVVAFDEGDDEVAGLDDDDAAAAAVSSDEPPVAVAGDEPGDGSDEDDDEAAEVARLLRQLRGR